MATTELRFGILTPQDAPVPVLAERWRRAEDLGFDLLYVADHTADWRDLGSYWLEGWSILPALAAATSRVRVGTLVSNPILRHPVLLAKEAATIDQVSGGRLELGIGTGIAGFDHAAMGMPYWAPAERVRRFTEFVEVVDGVLRSTSGPFRFSGEYFATMGTPMNPGPLQRPRPPITLGGQSPTVLRLVAERGDCWNTHGPFGATPEEIVAITERQNRRLDDLCAARGRDPAEVRRSVLLLEATDAWSSPDALETYVEQFAATGVTEFVVIWPPEHRVDLLERAGTDVLPRLRGTPAPAGA